MNRELLRQFLIDSNKAGYAGGGKRNGSKNLTVQPLFLLKKMNGDLMITFLEENLMVGEL